MGSASVCVCLVVRNDDPLWPQWALTITYVSARKDFGTNGPTYAICVRGTEMELGHGDNAGIRLLHV